MQRNKKKGQSKRRLVEDFVAYAQEFLREESPIYEIMAQGQCCEGVDLGALDLRGSHLEDCSFYHCNLEGASFVDTIFQSCDFSNSNLKNVYVERCSFLDCKCVGMDFSGGVLKQSDFEGCNLRYANGNKAKMTSVVLERSNLSEASLSGGVLRNVEARESSFMGTNFCQTSLAGMDFSENIFCAPLLSSPPFELKGAIISPLQAEDLIGLWGLIVKRL